MATMKRPAQSQGHSKGDLYDPRHVLDYGGRRRHGARPPVAADLQKREGSRDLLQHTPNAHNECTFYTFRSTPRVGGGGGRWCMKMSFVHSQFSLSPTGLQENECGPYCRPSWCRPWCSETCPTSSGCPRPIAVRVQSALGSGRRRKDDGIGRRKEEEGEGVGRRGYLTAWVSRETVSARDLR